MHDFPKRAHRWHRLTACGVHFALAVVHATHALLLTVDIVGFMMSHRMPDRKRSDRLTLDRLLRLDRENRTIRSERFVIHQSIYKREVNPTIIAMVSAINQYFLVL